MPGSAPGARRLRRCLGKQVAVAAGDGGRPAQRPTWLLDEEPGPGTAGSAGSAAYGPARPVSGAGRTPTWPAQVAGSSECSFSSTWTSPIAWAARVAWPAVQAAV